MDLILASGSPRRRELMSLITPDYTVITSDVDETKIAADSPAHLAKALASGFRTSTATIRTWRQSSSLNILIPWFSEEIRELS